VRALRQPGNPVKPAEWPAAAPAPPAPETRESRETRETADGIGMHDLAAALRDALAGSPACLVRLPLGWHGADLAVEGTGRVPVAVLGDGDLLMGGTALWTAAHYRLPLLVVVANNASFHNDVVHAERMAGQRRRPARNTRIGQAISDPDPDLPAFARSLGFHAAGQVRDRSALPAALAAAVAAARSGQCALVDVRIRPDD